MEDSECAFRKTWSFYPVFTVSTCISKLSLRPILLIKINIVVLLWFCFISNTQLLNKKKVNVIGSNHQFKLSGETSSETLEITG